ncbi:D-alanyl-D-alanine carboxypeptidase family protein, partial [Paraclostridium bifermentans]
GFILRYPEGKQQITGVAYEPWHIRYVGEKVAKKIYDEQITLEEFLEKN